jgi:lysophosphatidate acyltransferase
LPPVPTTGLTSEDTSTLAVHVRDQMLQALRDISAKVSVQKTEKEGEFDVGSSTSETRVNPGLAAPPRPVEVVTSEGQIPIQQKPFQEAASEGGSLAMSASASSLNTWKSGASETGTETEEDEGMILVGRPA